MTEGYSPLQRPSCYEVKYLAKATNPEKTALWRGILNQGTLPSAMHNFRTSYPGQSLSHVGRPFIFTQ